MEHGNSWQVGQATLWLRMIAITLEEPHVIIRVMNIGNGGEQCDVRWRKDEAGDPTVRMIQVAS